MDAYLNKIKEQWQKNPTFAYSVAGAGICVFLCLVMWGSNGKEEKIPAVRNKEQHNAIGVTVGDSEKLEFMKGLQKNYYDFEDRIKHMEEQVKGIKESTELFKKDQQVIVSSLSDIRETLTNNSQTDETTKEPHLELAVAPIKNNHANDFVYLPIGSFCKGTLLTGVYASSDINSPLPVLITLDEAFYGPNKTRIPLKGAYVLGKAVGDINTQRALIQIVAISLVLPNGKVFEHEQDIGYVTDDHGELGIQGQIVRNTGKALGMTFLGGFMAGGSSALAEGEVSSVSGRFGGVERSVTGSVGRHALFTGLAKSTGDLAQYYEKQAENIIPAVHIPSGRDVYFIVQKGVKINGLLHHDFIRHASFD